MRLHDAATAEITASPESLNLQPFPKPSRDPPPVLACTLANPSATGSATAPAVPLRPVCFPQLVWRTSRATDPSQELRLWHANVSFRFEPQKPYRESIRYQCLYTGILSAALDGAVDAAACTRGGGHAHIASLGMHSKMNRCRPEPHMPQLHRAILVEDNTISTRRGRVTSADNVRICPRAYRYHQR